MKPSTLLFFVLLCTLVSNNCASDIDARSDEELATTTEETETDAPEGPEEPAEPPTRPPVPGTDPPNKPPENTSRSFISTWQVRDTDNRTIVLPLPAGHNYNFTVEWGDGSHSHVNSDDDPSATNVYQEVGTYEVVIHGVMEAWSFEEKPQSRDMLLTVSSLGDVNWKSLAGAFWQCKNLTAVSGGDTSEVTSMVNTFAGADQLDPDVRGWDVSRVIDMTGMFGNATMADPEVRDWDTDSVTDMSWMFAGATSAEPVMDVWNFRNIKDMTGIFAGRTLSSDLYSGMLRQIRKTQKNSGVYLDGGYSRYGSSVAKDRHALVAEDNWVIFDGGPE